MQEMAHGDVKSAIHVANLEEPIIVHETEPIFSGTPRDNNYDIALLSGGTGGVVVGEEGRPGSDWVLVERMGPSESCPAASTASVQASSRSPALPPPSPDSAKYGQLRRFS